MRPICRRAFPAASGVLLLTPRAAWGQQAAKVHRVGVLGLTSAVAMTDRPFMSLRADLLERGYVEGQTLVIETRFAGGKPERLPQLARELLEARVDVIVAGTEAAVRAAKQATSSAPIVFVAIPDRSRQVSSRISPSPAGM